MNEYTVDNVLTEEEFYSVAIGGTGCTGIECTGYVLTATARLSQVADGNLTLGSNGVKGPAEKW